MYYCPELKGPILWLLVPPRKMRKELLDMAYAGFIASHMGIQKTRLRLAAKLYWAGWRSVVEDYVKSCSVCAKRWRGAPSRRGALQVLTTGAPWERLAIDVTGPHLQRLAAEYGGYKSIYVGSVGG